MIAEAIAKCGIQKVTDLPNSVDSPSADVLTQAYQFCKRPGLFNDPAGRATRAQTAVTMQRYLETAAR